MTESLHICSACGYEFEQATSPQVNFHSLPDQWQCPGCGIEKLMFHHYACQDIIAEITGKLPPFQPFSPVEMPRLS